MMVGDRVDLVCPISMQAAEECLVWVALRLSGSGDVGLHLHRVTGRPTDRFILLPPIGWLKVRGLTDGD
jgi:hypothetical protein